jgi:phage-related protein
MAQWVSFRGVSTATLTGVEVATMPSHRKAAMRTTQYKIKGRDGVLHTDDGFDNFDMLVRLMIVDADSTMRQTVNAWADGTGKLISSDDPAKCWIASVQREITWYRDEVGGTFYDTAEIVFNCQPIMREATPTVYTLTADGTISSIGDYEAQPMIKITGSGTCTLSINGTEMSFSGLSSSVPVFVDCENGYVYTASGATTMTGEFPHMVMGTNTVDLGGGTTSVEITANWGWV